MLALVVGLARIERLYLVLHMVCILGLDLAGNPV